MGERLPLPPHLEIEFSSIQFGKRIENGCGAVYAGTLATNEAVAIKELTGPRAVDAFIKECGRHMMLHHRNIVRVRGMSQDGLGHVYIITELAPGGSLADVLNSQPQRNDWATLVRWALDIAHSLQYLHSLSPPVLHLNLKPQNVLLCDDDTAKLCDFGIASCRLQRSSQYAAPELFEGMPGTEATDVYGFGGVLFAMITNSGPWEGLSVLKIFGTLMAGTPPSLPSPLPAQCPDTLAAIVQRCLQIDPRQRCTLSQVIEDLEQVRDKLGARDPSRVATQQLPLVPPTPNDVPSPKSLLEILKLFESCPAPPARRDIPARHQKPTLRTVIAEYDRIQFFFPRSNFLSDRDHEDAMTVGLYTDESFVYWLVNAWANDTSADRERGLRHVGPFMQRLIEALPRCCPRYIGPAVRVLRADEGASQAMQNAFADYERQYAAGTLICNFGFVSFTRGSTPIRAFTSHAHVLVFCRAIEAYDVDAYSMVRITRHSEMEVLCPPPSAFRVVQPPSKTERTVSVCTDMQAAPQHHPSTVARHDAQDGRAQNGMALEYASDVFRGERAIVLAAVEHDGMALEYASDVFRGDREFVLAAVSVSGMPCRLLAAPGVSTPAIRVVVGKPRRGPRLPSILVCGDGEANPGPRGMSGARQRANESTGRTPQSTGSLTSVRKQGLRVSTLNVAGVKEGISEIVNEMEDRAIDLCVICETRSKPREMQRVLTRSGAMYVVSYSGETCAGIGLIYREALGSGKDPRGWHVEGVEFYTRTITGFIGGPDGSRIKFIGAYAPQKRNTVERDLFFEQLGRLVPPSVGCLLLGDLNLQCSASAQLSMREQRLRTRFLQEMAARDLRDLASGSNRRSSWTWAGKSGVVAGRRARLDYIFARLPRSEVRRFRVMNVALPTDHRLVTADLEIPTAVQSNGRKYRVRAVLAGLAREKAFPVVTS